MIDMTVATAIPLNGPISALAGKTFRMAVYWTDPKTNEVKDASEYNAILQIRDLRHTKKVLLNVEESTAPNAVFFRDTDPDTSDQRWMVVLGKSYTSWLPDEFLIEAELVNTTNADDVEPLIPGVVVKMQPEGVYQ